MARYTSPLLVPLLLVLLLLSFSHAAREAAASVRNHAEVGLAAGDEEALSFSTAAEDEGCSRDGAGGWEGEEEECLMRRTLVAHTDYIYTQGGDHN